MKALHADSHMHVKVTQGMIRKDRKTHQKCAICILF